jgi:hypothetical protein
MPRTYVQGCLQRRASAFDCSITRLVARVLAEVSRPAATRPPAAIMLAEKRGGRACWMSLIGAAPSHRVGMLLNQSCRPEDLFSHLASKICAPFWWLQSPVASSSSNRLQYLHGAWPHGRWSARDDRQTWLLRYRRMTTCIQYM